MGQQKILFFLINMTFITTIDLINENLIGKPQNLQYNPNGN